jgi:hypothetical protein
LGGLDAEVVYFDVDRSASRWESSRQVRDLLRSRRWDLVFMEGTSIVAGLPLIAAARRRGQRFVVSSGDPIGGFFHATRGPLWGSAFSVYERQLYRACAGYVGWTPYLTGLALGLGARRGVTIEGAADLNVFQPLGAEERRALRREYGLDPSHLVCGIVGSLTWVARLQHCYGLELIESFNRTRRDDLALLIVGDGDGRAYLEKAVRKDLRPRVRFTGRIPRNDVARAVNAMDVAFNTQSLDGLGSFRLATKLPEYLACGVPVAMSPIPGYYDYVLDAGWGLPPFHPASVKFADGTGAWLETLSRDEVQSKAAHARQAALRFDYDVLSARLGRFLNDLLKAPAH